MPSKLRSGAPAPLRGSGRGAPASAATWWTLLGRLLPREVRERVYEPACYDRLRDSLERGSQQPGVGIYAIGAFVGAAGRNMPRIWFDGRALSGIGRLTLAIGVVAAGLWILTAVRYAYAAGY